jgi:dUTP diphosphatase
MIQVVVENVSITGIKLPEYKHPGDSGMDVRADIEEPVTLKPLERRLISTGLKFKVPENIEIQVRPRSGLALKKGVTVLNTPGTVDESYEGVVGVILINLSAEEVVINPGDRIAQLVFARVEKAELNLVAKISGSTERGSGGFGSSGIN